MSFTSISYSIFLLFRILFPPPPHRVLVRKSDIWMRWNLSILLLVYHFSLFLWLGLRFMYIHEAMFHWVAYVLFQVLNMSSQPLSPRLYAISERMRGVMIRGVHGKDLGEMKVYQVCCIWFCGSTVRCANAKRSRVYTLLLVLQVLRNDIYQYYLHMVFRLNMNVMIMQ